MLSIWTQVLKPLRTTDLILDMYFVWNFKTQLCQTLHWRGNMQYRQCNSFKCCLTSVLSEYLLELKVIIRNSKTFNIIKSIKPLAMPDEHQTVIILPIISPILN